MALTYRRQVNHPGLAMIALDGDHALVGNVADKWTIEIWRRNPAYGVDWYVDFDGIYRGGRRRGRNPGTFFAYCPGQLDRLAWRHVLWTAGTDLRSQFTSDKAETVMKTLVDYNAGTNATTGNGRERTGTMSEITIQTDGANGNTINHYCAWEELLKSLQRVAAIAGGDFDLVKTAAATWQFRWYTGQLGTDRSATVQFSEELGNMADAEYLVDHRDERTAALVAGGGDGANREIAIRTGADYHATNNNIETYVDARNVKEGDTAGLQAAGDARLAQTKVRTDFAFDVIQTPSSYYGAHYFLGDLVGAVNPFTGLTVTLKVDAVALTTSMAGPPLIRVYMVGT